MRSFILNISLLCIALTAVSCVTNGQPDDISKLSKHPNFDKHWNQGKAEVASYELTQARYGEIHKGEAVLIFVTEPFSKSKQVKMDNPAINKPDAVQVLKLNTTKQFNTGIYQYNLMTSTFQPIALHQYPKPLKITSSMQEWCGQRLFQLNQQGDEYKIESRSYFESEGDENFTIPKTWTEDQLLNLIRINPKALPVGKIEIIPNLGYLGMVHRPVQVENAMAEIVISEKSRTYKLEYLDFERELTIEFDSEFPFGIKGWTETYKSGYGSTAKVLTTKAKLKASAMVDYWNKNSISDEVLRQRLLQLKH